MKTIFRPDTCYVAAYLMLDQSVKDLLQKTADIIKKEKNHFSSVWDQILGECDHEQAEYYRQLPLSEIQKMVDIRLEKKKELQAALKNFEQLPVIVGKFTWCAIGWSVRRGCDLTLENGTFRVHVALNASCNSSSPNFYIEAGSAAFWSSDWRQLLHEMDQTIRSFGERVRPEIISRIDIAHHTQAIGTRHLEHENFVTKARVGTIISQHHAKADLADALAKPQPLDHVKLLCEEWAKTQDRFTWKNAQKTQQITFGRRGADNVFCRMYCKSRELSYKPEKKVLFQSIWKDAGFDLKKEVINIEFELCREYLREHVFTIDTKTFTIHTIQDVLNHFDALRAYLVGNDNNQGWIRMIAHNRTRRERSDLDPSWKLIREGCESVAKVVQAQRDQKMTPIRLKELQKRSSNLIVQLIREQGLEYDVSEYDSNKFVEILAVALEKFSERCAAHNEPTLSDLVYASASRQGFALVPSLAISA